MTSFAYFQGVKLKPRSFPTRIYILYYGYLNGLEVMGLYLTGVNTGSRTRNLLHMATPPALTLTTKPNPLPQK
jgi:hypothetical protein